MISSYLLEETKKVYPVYLYSCSGISPRVVPGRSGSTEIFIPVKNIVTVVQVNRNTTYEHRYRDSVQTILTIFYTSIVYVFRSLSPRHYEARGI
jgi:hypothetical protein